VRTVSMNLSPDNAITLYKQTRKRTQAHEHARDTKRIAPSHAAKRII